MKTYLACYPCFLRQALDAAHMVGATESQQRGVVRATLERVLTQSFAISDLAALREALHRARHVLYLGDNAGETVFDRLLIETLSPGDARTFFLLQTKCPVIAEDIGVPIASIILRQGGWTKAPLEA